MSKIHINAKVPPAGAFSRPVRDIQTPSIDNPDKTVSLVGQAVYPVDPNTDPLSYTMPCTVTPGGSVVYLKDTVLNDSDKIILTVPANQKVSLNYIGGHLIASATAGNRQLQIQVYRSGDVFYFGVNAGAVITAANRAQIQTWVGAAFSAAAVDKASIIDGQTVTGTVQPMPELILTAGDYVRVLDAAAIDIAADDMTTVIHYVAYPA